MLSNLFSPWLLARVIVAVTTLLLSLHALRTAARVIRHWRVASSSEGQLLLERRAELIATLVRVTTWALLAGLVLTVLGADRLTHSIQGAMCAYGVLDHSRWGFRMLLWSSVAACLGLGWTALHEYDLRFKSAYLTKAKFYALFALAPFAITDALTSTAFALDLDLSTAASCCSTSLGDAAQATYTAAPLAPSTLGYFALGSVLLASALSLASWKTGRAWAAWSSALATVLAVPASVAAVVWFVAPHVYETPVHTCPFCLFGESGHYLGWPIFGALFLAASAAISSAVILGASRAVPRHTGIEARSAMLQRLAGRMFGSWIIALAFCVYPVLRFVVLNPGASLFAGMR